MNKNNFDASWDTILNDIKNKMDDPEFVKWIKDLKILSFESNIITLRADNKYIKQWVEDKYLDKLKNALKDFYHLDCEIKIVLKSNKKIVKEEHENVVVEVRNSDYDYHSVPINKDYTFDTFISGKSNIFAYSTCLNAAKGFDKLNNPIYIYGDVGLGKTHLMHAVANYVRINHPKKNILCTTGELFMNEFVKSLQNKKVQEFKEKYDLIDLLLFDDVQVISRGPSTMDEFFFLFLKLYSNDKQIILTSNAYPDDIANLDKRLKSRFSGGIMPQIEPPSVEEKIAIIKKYSETNKYNFSDEVLFFIAENIKSESTRDLLGVVRTTYIKSKFKNIDVTIDFLQKDFPNMFIERNKTLTANNILDIICDYFNIKLIDLQSSSRAKNIVIPRNLAIYLIYNNTPQSLSSVGDIFKRDHSTIKNSLSNIQKSIDENDSYTVNTINELTKKMKLFVNG